MRFFICGYVATYLVDKNDNSPVLLDTEQQSNINKYDVASYVAVLLNTKTIRNLSTEHMFGYKTQNTRPNTRKLA